MKIRDAIELSLAFTLLFLLLGGWGAAMAAILRHWI